MYIHLCTWYCNKELLPSAQPFVSFITINYMATSFDHSLDTVSYTQPDVYLNPLTPNDHYSGRTAPLTSKRCILYIYSTNIGTEYFKHGIHSPFFPLQNAVCFINLTYLLPVLFTFYIQCVLKFKKINSGAKRLRLPYMDDWYPNLIIKWIFNCNYNIFIVASCIS